MNIEEIDPEIMAGLRRVEASKKIVHTPRGSSPSCCPKLWTHFCQRCGRNMKKRFGGPCKRIPRSERWSPVYDNQEAVK